MFQRMRSRVFRVSELKRMVHLLAPDVNERLVRRANTRKNFDETFSKLTLPFKLRRSPEKSREFIWSRLEQYPDGFEPIDIEKYQQIVHEVSDEKQRNQLQDDIRMVLMFYNDVLRTSLFAPKEIPVEDMRKMLFKYETHQSRFRYVNHLFIREYDEWTRQLEAEERRKNLQLSEMEDHFENVGCFDQKDGTLQYGYWRNTLFTRYFQKGRHRQTLNALRKAQMFGQPLVVDCSLEHLMADYELLSCARQLSNIYHTNRYSMDPFQLHFTGYSHQNRSSEYLHNSLKDYMEKPEFCLNIHEESYQRLLPQSRFIYLSPDSRKIMTKFDHDAVYIIGALVSKTQKSALTLQKAQEEGLECVRLPLHQYVQLKPQVKRVLSFRNVFRILLELKHGADWETALRRSIPPHKLMDDYGCPGSPVGGCRPCAT